MVAKDRFTVQHFKCVFNKAPPHFPEDRNSYKNVSQMGFGGYTLSFKFIINLLYFLLSKHSSVSIYMSIQINFWLKNIGSSLKI